jgi:flagellar biosynthesis GTPase FlhF
MKHHPRDKKPIREKVPKRGGPKDHDDDEDESMDESGNIRGLIDYEYDSEEGDNDSELSYSASEIRRLKKSGKLPESLRKSIRKSGFPVRSKKLIRESSSDSTWKEAEVPAKKKGRRLRKQSDSSEEESDVVVPTGRHHVSGSRRGTNMRKVREEVPRGRKSSSEESESLGSEDTDEEDEEEEYEDDEDDEDTDEEDEEDESAGFKGISISFGGGGGAEPNENMIPKRHNMKKESEDVKRFVKLVTKPVEQETIDDQIDQFKSMEAPRQKVLLDALEKRSDYTKKEQPLMFRLLQMDLKAETMALVMQKYNAMNGMDPSSGEYYKLRSWMEKLVSIPLGVYKEMPVRLDEGPDTCGVFMEKAKKCLNDAIYGQDEAKLQILQFIAGKIANPTASGLSLLLLGPPGIGKTSLIKNGIAKALEWPFQFISLGGDSDASTYTGHQLVYEGSHSGKIANCLAQAKSMSTILMFDELDKISATPKGEEVQNLLVHLTDPVQNMDFEDKYLSGIPLDLSRAMFVFSGNDPDKIDKILMDRMVVVRLAGYESKDKIAIAEQYLLPTALREVNLMEKVAIGRDIIQHILETYAKEETGVRELKRCLEQIAQRINMLRMFNVKELPFHIPGFSLPFVLKKEHVDLFLKKKDTGDKVPFGMYT